MAIFRNFVESGYGICYNKINTMERWHMQVILASRSPRRRELLKDLFEDFEVIPCDVEEKTSLKRGHAICQYLAKIKLGDLPTRRPDALIISADTVVYMDGRVYGKPQDERQAKKFLDELSGKRHSVYTGVAIYWQGDINVFYDKSYVTFKTLSERDKLDYIATLSPMDKAGGYGIQDSAVVKSYDGSYSNIVGLPMEKLKAQLAKILK